MTQTQQNATGPLADLARPRHIRRSNMRVRWGGDASAGTSLAAWTPIDATNARAALLSLGAGQRKPPCYYSSEHVVLPLAGELVCEVGDERIVLGRHDLLFIPAGPEGRFSMVNVGETTAAWFSVDLPLEDRPAHLYADDGAVVELGQAWPYDDEGRSRA